MHSLALLHTLPVLVATLGDSPTVLDDFTDPSRWSIVASEGVTLSVHADGDALRLDVDFVSGAGYAGIRRELPLDLPPNFELAFSVRGDLPPNNLEFKLVDPTGHNVWWVNRRAFEMPGEWTRLASRRRHFEFAWGPSNAPLPRAGAVEIVLASAEGGKGSVWLDDLTFRPLPEVAPYTGTPTLGASSDAGPDAVAAHAMDADADSWWRSSPADVAPSLTIDFGATREFGGLVIEWTEALRAAAYELSLSDDGQTFTPVRSVDAATGRTQFISLPDAEARAVRIDVRRPSGDGGVAIREIEILPIEASRDANAFAMEVAKRSPRGHHPRAMLGEGTFWTVVGAPGDDKEALVSEDGAVEVDKGAFSIEPFLSVDGELLTWADATTGQSLFGGVWPIPTVTRERDDLALRVTACAVGSPPDTRLCIRYEVDNARAEAVEGSLFLAIRPLQVNPPYQWLNTVGGVSRIDRIALGDSGRTIEVDDRLIALGEAPDSFGAAVFDEGDVSVFLAEGDVPPHSSVTDPQRSASAALAYPFELEPGETRSWVVCVPFHDAAIAMELPAELDAGATLEGFSAQSVSEWARLMGQAGSPVVLLVPESEGDLVSAVQSTLAYILINADGPSIQPGSRSYERSWIRDGSLTTAALLRFGLFQQAEDFIDWYAPFQFDSGKVPCVVDRRGPDPVPENDSHGQLIMAVANVHRFTGDRTFLERHWPRVRAAANYIDSLRAQRLTPEFSASGPPRQEPGKPPVPALAFRGLVPESISHEGYSAKPMHSYWDDFFTLRGLKDAAYIAAALGHTADAARYASLADEFARDLYASIDLAMRTHGIDYIPGCVELGDFDATSTTIALWPCAELSRLPRPALDRTFDRYWDQFLRRRDDPSFAWDAYTPYELRCVGSLVLLGQVDRAHEALDFFMNDRRPIGWNQWPEVIYREPRAPRFLGDLPHTWCGSDFLNSVRMMFLHEDEADDSLILLAGIPADWLSTESVGFHDMPTFGGRVSCVVRQRGPTIRGDRGDQLLARIEGTCPVPDGGIRMANPAGPVLRATVNGQSAEIDAAGRVVVRGLPADIVIDAPTGSP